jgi:transcriptional regulator with XRE-family HTH domain
MSSIETPNRIREWRNRRRMSLAELGEAVGLSRSEISKLESGSRRVRADHLVVLAKALKVAPEDLMDQNAVRELIGDTVPTIHGPASLGVVPTRRQKGAIIILRDEPSVAVEAPPQVANVTGAYAFYMPDTTLEPRVPVGALLYVHPLLPPRAGDLAIVAVDGEPPALASVERRSNALIALIGNDGTAVDLNDSSVVSAERVAGMWFP